MSLSLLFMARFEEMEERYHMTMAELQEKSNTISNLESQRDHFNSDSSARIANLNQILLQTKQACGQLEVRNEELEAQERMLLEENETLEKKCVELASRLEEPCKLCKKLENRVLARKDHNDQITRSISTPVTPLKFLPEQTEVDQLLEENSKLKQKYDCLFANYQMVSEKSSQLKKDLKDSEKSLADLQTLCDTLKTEKEEMELKYKHTQQTVLLHQDQESSSKKRHELLKEETDTLSHELGEIQTRHDDLLQKNTDLQSKLQLTQDTVTNLRSQVSSLKIEKMENEQSLVNTRSRLDELIEELQTYKDCSSSSLQSSMQKENTLAMYKTKLEEIKKEKEDLVRQLDDLTNILSNIEEEKTNLETLNKELQSKVELLNAQRLKADEVKQASLTASEEIVALQIKLTDLSEKNEELMLENKQLKTTIEETQTHAMDLKTSISKYQHDSRVNQDEVSKLQIELENVKSQQLATSEELATKIEELLSSKQFIKQLKKELNMTIETKTALENEITHLRMKIDELETANFELDACLIEATNHSNTSLSTSQQHHTKVTELQRKLDATGSVLYEKESILNDLQISYDLLKKENSSLLTQLDRISQSLAATMAEADDLRTQLGQYEFETEAIAAQITELETLHLDCQPTRVKLENELETARDQLSNLQDQLAASKREASSFKLEVKQERKANNDLESVIEELQNQLQCQQNRNDELSTITERHESQLLELTKHVQSKSELLRTAEKEMNQLRKELQENQLVYAKEVECSESKYYQLQESYDSLLAQNRQASSDHLKLTMEIEELHCLKNDSIQEREKLEQELDRIKEEKASFQKQLETLQSQWKEAKRDLRYQKRKVCERERSYEKQYSQVLQQFTSLRKEALTVLSESSAPNMPKGILRNKTKSVEDESVLRPLENIPLPQQ